MIELKCSDSKKFSSFLWGSFDECCSRPNLIQIISFSFVCSLWFVRPVSCSSVVGPTRIKIEVGMNVRVLSSGKNTSTLYSTFYQYYIQDV